MADPCPICDRAECPRFLRERAGMPPKLRAAFKRMLDDANATPPRRLRDEDRALAAVNADAANADAADCRAHAVEWRDEALRLRAELERLRAEVPRG